VRGTGSREGVGRRSAVWDAGRGVVHGIDTEGRMEGELDRVKKIRKINELVLHRF
jgi:hypothetical protein